MIWADIRRPKKPLPPLLAGTAYEAQDFESLEYSGSMLTGSKAILRLHLKNATTIDLPIADEELRHLLNMLVHAFPADAKRYVEERGG